MTRLNLWAKITGADKKKKYPQQQAVSLGRTGDYFVLFPYGMYCNAPNGALAKELAQGVIVPVTVGRPAGAERGEPVFYHPKTGAKITFKNSGDIDIDAGEANLVVACSVATVNASTKVDVNSPQTNLGSGGEAIARKTDPVKVTIPANSITTSDGATGPTAPLDVTGTITDGGDNTSI